MSVDHPETLDDDAWLARGQSLEAAGTPESLAKATECYDRAIAILQSCSTQTANVTQRLAIAWMNRGNSLQKQSGGALDAVHAYDRAISLFALLPTDEVITNRTGAAWLNRGQALQRVGDVNHQLEAVTSTQQAAELLSKLPVDSNLDYRLNLAGAQTNLAQLLIESELSDRYMRASAAVATALELTAQHEQQRAGFADIGLKARRTLCQIIGQWLIATDDAEQQAKLIARASDTVDTGMLLARHWESLGAAQFRPLTERLFRFGTAFYQRHQVHFLADFVRENLDPSVSSDAITTCPELRVIASEALTSARNELRTNFTIVSHDAASERRLQALEQIESALTRLSDHLPHTS